MDLNLPTHTFRWRYVPVEKNGYTRGENKLAMVASLIFGVVMVAAAVL
ncbi:hypothetical protein [Mesorhizobium sp. M8A.F.Ca.ET.165.01.1.1]|nr:hypothetical protein [Mesorhizobium sp. M8A.F.Ca.ET.165.01.1.1]